MPPTTSTRVAVFTHRPGDYTGALALTAAALALLVVGLGAYVRLSDAGLGCPDWPGCYGHYVGIPTTPAEHAAASSAFPGNPVDPGKAWKEMAHRYLAGTLGLLVVILFARAWRHDQRPPVFEGLLLLLIGIQALLGMWTVTLLLKPAIVTLHLLGGMLTWALLACRAISRTAACPPVPASPALQQLAAGATALLLLQIALGGWVSSNYAALACPDLPTCLGQWWPPGHWSTGFQILRDLGRNADGVPLNAHALIAIHWAHRVGALITVAAVGTLAWQLAACTGTRTHGIALAFLLVLQASLGIANVILQLPLPIAVAHNLGAAALLAGTLLAAVRTRRQA